MKKWLLYGRTVNFADRSRRLRLKRRKIFLFMKTAFMRIAFISMGGLFLAVLVSGCQRQPVTERGFLLDTIVSVTVYRGPTNAAKGALALCGEYETVFSRTNPDSELYKLNHRETDTPPPELLDVICLGLEYGERTNGAFSVTMGAVSGLWDFHAEKPSLPDAEEVAKKTASAGREAVTVQDGRVFFQNPDVELDLGGIAKGYIAGQLAAYLQEQGVTSALIDLGGNLYCLGSREDGTPFQIGVQYPYEDRNVVIGGLPAENLSVITSGVYERGFVLDGTVYHHILNPATGWPVENELLAVTITSKTPVVGDILSTACFVLGLEHGLALVEEIPEAEAVFITKDFQIHLSSGLEGVFYATES